MQMEMREVDWVLLLDRLAACITPQEEAAARRAAVDRGSPSHLRQLHSHVASLLVKHGLTTWTQLRTSFPKHHPDAAEDLGQKSHEAHMAINVASPSRVQGGKATAEDDAAKPDHFGSRMHAPHEPQSHHAPLSGLKRKAAGGPDEADCSRQAESGMTQGGGAHIQEQPENEKYNYASSEGSQPSLSRSPKEGSTLADYPRIVSWWHPTKNGTNLPADTKRASRKRVWLQCPGCPTCGEVHQWDAVASQLTRCGCGCPSCTPGTRSFCSCRAISANELLAAEWHEDSPPPITVHLGSGKRYKWRCADAACGHVWEAQPRHRSRPGGTNCPDCYSKKHGKNKHPSVAVGRPDLLAEWDEQKNTLLPTEVSCGIHKKVWWLCQVCGNSWQTRVQDTALTGSGCPRCTERR